MRRTFTRLLRALIPEEQVRDYLDTFDLLYTIKGEDTNISILQIISIVKDSENSEIIDVIQNSTLSNIQETLKNFGIFLNIETLDITRLADLNNILRAVINIEVYEDPAHLLEVFEIEEDSVDIFLKIVSIIALIDEHTVEGLIDRINIEFIDNLRAVLVNRLDELPTQDEIEPTKLPGPLLRKFIDKGYGENVSPYIKDILGNRPYTLKLFSILKMYGNRLADNKSGEHDWALVFISCSEGEQNPETPILMFKDVWDRYYLNMDDYIRMNQKVTAIFKTLGAE